MAQIASHSIGQPVVRLFTEEDKISSLDIVGIGLRAGMKATVSVEIQRNVYMWEGVLVGQPKSSSFLIVLSPTDARRHQPKKIWSLDWPTSGDYGYQFVELPTADALIAPVQIVAGVGEPCVSCPYTIDGVLITEE